MYTREIQPARDTPLENGLPVQGTWDRAFREVNLLDIHRPFRVPLPAWAIDFRIKEWQSFSVQDDRFFFSALLANFKLFCLAKVRLYDKESGESFQFRKLLPGNLWHLPRSLANSSAGSFSPRFFFRIHNWLDADTVNLNLDIEACRTVRGCEGQGKCAVTVDLGFNLAKQDVCPMAVSLCFSERRSMYAFKAVAAVWGDIIFGNKRIIMDPAKTTGIFCDCKGFFPYRMRTTLCGTMGFTADGRRYGFHVAENQARETNRNNENALWINGRLCPLPPVRITMPKGIDSDWIIQDMEGMVDLVFSPKSYKSLRANTPYTSVEYYAPLGLYSGMLLNSDGEQIQVHNMFGMGESLYLRV